ncbi:MAG TPA: DUF2064 domain-containing protein [Gammaproteobacteria bacterium]|nr:DUF2064 domain-containing protein [Gammaproteobacteria bacterium]
MPRNAGVAARRAGPSSLVVFFKAPGRAKRRLAAAVGSAAQNAAEHLLACTLEDARGWTGDVFFAAAAEADARWLTRRSPRAGEVLVQRGDSLGERINRVDAQLRSRGIERLIYIGTDCPAIDHTYLARADIALGRMDAVLGPALDGGVVLMGSRRPWPSIAKLAWSTPALRAGLVDTLRGRGWTIQTLAALRDIDRPQDLEAAADDLADDARPARAALAAWLRSRQTRRAQP